MGTEMSLAFLGGLLSFFSPCVLPVAPGYLAIITGSSLAELRTESTSRGQVIRTTLSFLAGLAFVFILLGAAGSLLGGALRSNRILLSKLAGIVVIFLGLHQGGWLRIPWLYRERRMEWRPQVGSVGAFLTGAAFSLGWTPCVGPVLGSILALAGSDGNPLKGALLLGIYSVGLATPFILLALAFEKVSGVFNRIKPYFKYLEWATGGLLLLMGVLLLTGGLSGISAWFIRLTGGWNPENLLSR